MVITLWYSIRVLAKPNALAFQTSLSVVVTFIEFKLISVYRKKLKYVDKNIQHLHGFEGTLTIIVNFSMKIYIFAS